MIPKKAYQRLPAQRQQEIIEKTTKLYAQHPFEDVTVRMICAELEININTFYRYFDTRDDLFIYIFSKLTEKSAISEDTIWTLEDFLRTEEEEMNCYTEDERKMILRWRSLPDELLSRIFFDPQLNGVDFARKSIAREKALGHLREDVDVELAAYMFATSGYLLVKYEREHNITALDEIIALKRYYLYTFMNYGMRGHSLPERDTK